MSAASDQPGAEGPASERAVSPSRAPTRIERRRLGKYLLRGRLGRGGMGLVLEAEDPVLQRRVALKVFKPAVLSQAGQRDRFLREARAVAQLNHPNVVTLYDVGEDAGQHYLAMEFAPGGSLQDTLERDGRLPWPAATRILIDACRGLAAGHAAGFLHRDVKPANILLAADGTAKLADFGLVLPRDAAPRLTREGCIVGTPAYMSPEQCRGDPLNDLSDVYALGATYYALLAGRPPYEGDSPLQISVSHCTAPVPDPRAVNPEVPEPCAAIVRRAMAKGPADRYQSAVALLAALEEVQAKLPVPAASTNCAGVRPELSDTATRLPAPSLPSRRKRAQQVAFVLVIVLAILAAVTAVFLSRREKETAQPPGERLVIPHDGLVLPVDGRVEVLAFTPDGRQLAAGLFDGAGGVVLRDLERGATAHLAPGMKVRAVAFAGDGRHLAWGDMAGTGVRLRDLTAGTDVSLSVGGRAAVRALGFLGDHGLAAGLSPWGEDGPFLCVWNLKDLAHPRVLAGHTAEVWALAMAPGGTAFASSARDGTVRVWDTAAGKAVHTFQFTVAKFRISPSVAIAPDGRSLAIAVGGRVSLYDWGTWKERPVVLGSDNAESIWSIAFAGDSRFLITAGPRALLWDVATGKRVADLGRDGATFHGAASTVQGRVAALGGSEGNGRHFVLVRDLQPFLGSDGRP